MTEHSARDKVLKEFPCTHCGACCALGAGDAYLRKWGWVREDGSCKYYDWKTKDCTIYHDRPWFCQVQCRFPDQWAKVLAYCDEAHRRLYGEDREQEGDCPHQPKRMEGDAASLSGDPDLHDGKVLKEVW